ncbi:Dabb family protein [Dietzia timorensis]|uniref:Dabb family protein n=1 Tax=Dietzia timorensis TaxID=499555 RepID=UPI00082B7CC6|nr:Dabb family protein [Dietzia timorensis]
MISHFVLYKYPPTMNVAQQDAFREQLADATKKTRIVQRFSVGEHVALPADDAARDSMYSVVARWDFSELDDLREFSEHPAMRELVDGWVRRLGIGVAFANTDSADEQVIQ